MNSKICAKFPFSSLLKAFLILLAINFISAAPAPPLKESIYTKFVKEMLANNCVMPDQIVFPFKLSSNTKGKVDSPLSICENAPVLRSKEAVELCREIFGIWKSISCRNISSFSNLPQINVTLSSDVCKDLSGMKSAIPKEEILLKSMTDTIVCEIMCDAVFEKTCQVLLWSYKVQSRIKEVQNAQPEVEKPENENALDKTEELPKKDETAPESSHSKLKASEPVQSLKTVEEPIESEKNAGTTSEAETSKTQSEAPSQAIAAGDEGNATEKTASEDTNAENTNTKSENQDVVNPDVPEETNEDAKAVEQPQKDSQTKESSSVLIKQASSTSTNGEATPQNPVIKDNEIQSKISSGSSPDKDMNKSPSDIKTTAEMDNTKTEESSKDNKKLSIFPPIKTANVDEPSAGKEPEDKDKATIVNTSSFQSTDVVSPEVSSLASVSDQTFPTLEKMEGDGDLPQIPNKVPDQYADLENTEADADDGEDYPRPNYDGRMDESAKTKHEIPLTSDASSVKVYVPDPNEKSFNEFPTIEKFGRGSDEMRVLAAFPDQEDSHFFFYFLSMVLILMSGYLIFHNKQKIIALIVEGRHERRRRSNGAGYKKLDTK